jgi:hypothetical protein
MGATRCTTCALVQVLIPIGRVNDEGAKDLLLGQFLQKTEHRLDRLPLLLRWYGIRFGAALLPGTG